MSTDPIITDANFHEEFDKLSLEDKTYVLGKVVADAFERKGVRDLMILARNSNHCPPWDSTPWRPERALQALARGIDATVLQLAGGNVDTATVHEGWMTIANVAKHLVDVVTQVLRGERPMVFLSEGQTRALYNTDAPEVDLEQVLPFPDWPVVVFPEGIVKPRWQARPGTGHIDIWPRMLIPVVAPQGLRSFDAVEKMAEISVYRQEKDVLLMGPCSIEPSSPVWTELSSASVWAEGNLAYMNFTKSVMAAVRVFGLTDDERYKPEHRMTRAQRRQDERKAKKLDYDARNIVSVRYLKDTHRVVKVSHASTGTTMAPHWRKGHYRNVRFGPMSMEHRPTREAFVGPVLVNAHLGEPQHAVAYMAPKEGK